MYSNWKENYKLYIITTTKLKCGNIGEEGAGKGQKKIRQEAITKANDTKCLKEQEGIEEAPSFDDEVIVVVDLVDYDTFLRCFPIVLLFGDTNELLVVIGGYDLLIFLK